MTADDTLSRYLLHELPPGEEEEVERRYFSDPEYLALLEAAEGDLIDAYVRGELTRAQRQRFEELFLCTRARRERLRVAEAMLAHMPQRQPRWRAAAVLALAASLLLAIGIGAWLWTRTPAATTTTPVAQQTAPRPAHIETPRAPVTASLALLPGLVRDASTPQKLVLTPGVEQVRVSALVEVEGDWRDLHASLRDANGHELWRAANLPLHHDRTVRLTIPAAKLTRGEHLLVVRAGEEPLGDYPFVVQK